MPCPLQFLDPVARSNYAWVHDFGIKAPQSKLFAGRRIDELQRLYAIPRFKLMAPRMRLSGDLNDRIAESEPGAGRQIVQAQVEIDVQLIAGQRPTVFLLGNQSNGSCVHERQLRVGVGRPIRGP